MTTRKAPGLAPGATSRALGHGSPFGNANASIDRFNALFDGQIRPITASEEIGPSILRVMSGALDALVRERLAHERETRPALLKRRYPLNPIERTQQ